MAQTINEETLLWLRMAAFANLSEYVLTSGASVDDAEELLFGAPLPGSLPCRLSCLTGGRAYSMFA